ncbi:cupin domain-containing protein [Pseudomonas sp. JS3066]|jgi:quercetin dioxygenase-like cupin family protein|uniref:cupin domain-containing protein n=1 Tax=unclassified Pseudomonas TaxID=196821 RepID=UPI000EAACCC4|nr:MULTISPECIES: cupin domain-containing protein [unclassified Pseudomonas]AYF85717.1 cupin domain-containing protein [Pseudomonas sp. DY-1]MDH4651800.1 cupin domain-containing protein [Pseudomonas sp. BN606]MRK20553.1 cupin domain-containing protein [Pseudomonas sp. JG-B]WVK91698.1 cupin domain-containing protein [Pseudomonas sp. JS3066]
MRNLKTLSALAAGLMLLNLPQAYAHETGEGQEQVTILHDHELLNAPGKQAILLTVDYAPGQRSVAHSHAGSVLAYVEEGEVISQLKGEEPKRYKAGESWYEPAGSVHLQSRNASDSKPAKLVVWMLKTEQEAVLEPYPK